MRLSRAESNSRPFESKQTGIFKEQNYPLICGSSALKTEAKLDGRQSRT